MIPRRLGPLSLGLALALPLQARILFQDMPAQKVCGGGEPWVREFDVPQACSETVHIQRIRGVTREHQGEARLWLDNTLLGPLRREFGQGGWQSPAAVEFSQGKHSLSIECGAEPFEIQGVVIGSGAQDVDPSDPPRRPRPQAQEPAEALPAPTPDCPGLALNTQWYPGRPSRTIMLSVVAGRSVKTPMLATLKQGERLRWWFYIHPRMRHGALEYPPVVVAWQQDDEGPGTLSFSIDYHELMRSEGRAGGAAQKNYEGRPKGYVEDKWTPLDLAWCPGDRLSLSLNRGEVHGEFSAKGVAIPLRIQTSEIEFEIKGENH
jgi:hypothetical protein